MPKPKRTHRFFRFSLRTLLILTAAAAGLAFAWMKLVEPYRLQREAMAAITKLGGSYKTEDVTGWVRYLDKHVQDVVAVDLADCDKPDEYLPHLERLPKLRTLVVGGNSVGDEQVAAVERMPTLRGLILDSTKVSAEAVEQVTETLPDLLVYKSERRAIAELRRVGVSFWVRELPSRYKGVPAWLKSEMGDVYFVNQQIIGIQISASVAAFTGKRATDGDLTWLAHLPDMTAIDLPDAHIDGTFLKEMVTPSSLRRLLLGHTNVTDCTLAHVSRFSNLEHLQLNNTDISDEGLAHVAALKRLEMLDLNDTGISDDGLAHLAELRRLVSLSVYGTRITDVGLTHIAGLPQLQTFLAGHTSLGDRGLAVVANLPSLKSLYIQATLVTDDGLVHLKRSKSLKELWLKDTKITDNCVPHLEMLRQLEGLNIEGTGISPGGVKTLKAALPNCDILH